MRAPTGHSVRSSKCRRVPDMGGQPTIISNEYRPNQRKDVLRRAGVGELNPRQAEAEAKRLGLAPLSSKPDDSEFDPRKKSRWSLAMALAWIVWRDFEEVRLWDNEFRRKCWDWKPVSRPLPETSEEGPRSLEVWVVAQSEPTNGVTFELWGYIPLSKGLLPVVEGHVSSRAKHEFWEALQDEKLVGEGVPAGGGTRRPILALEWQDLEAGDLTKFGGEKFNLRHERAGNVYDDITFRRDEILATWPAGEPPRSATSQPPRRRSPKPSDPLDLERWVDARVAGGQPPPRRKDTEGWAVARGLSVAWARGEHAALPPTKKLKPGEGLTDWKAKRP